LRNPWAEIPGERTHIAVQELVPGFGKRFGELVRVIEPAFRNGSIDRIELQRQVGRQHRRRVSLRRVKGIRHGALRLGILWRPLFRTGRTRRQLPVVLEQVLQESVVPPGGVAGPDTFEAAGDRDAVVAGLEAVLPADTLLLDSRGFGFRTDILRPD